MGAKKAKNVREHLRKKMRNLCKIESKFAEKTKNAESHKEFKTEQTVETQAEGLDQRKNGFC